MTTERAKCGCVAWHLDAVPQIHVEDDICPRCLLITRMSDRAAYIGKALAARAQAEGRA